MRIAVIGSGIAGMAAAYHLSRAHEVSLFEKEDRVGGHTHTVRVDSSAGPVAVDTGFIVHNDRTYPNLVRLFAELGVGTQASDMSFSVFRRDGSFEYSSRGFGGFFAQRPRLFDPGHYRLLSEILRFNREAPRLLDDPSAETMTLADFIGRGRYAPTFTENYLYPMASAVWSMSMEALGSFPALTLVRFFQNHGMLGINTHPVWKVVRGGSASYIDPLTAPYRDRIHTGSGVTAIARDDKSVTLRFKDRAAASFDQVVLACHGDQALALIESPSERERTVLGSFATSRNEVCLHTDASFLPRRAAARASWNYCLGSGSDRGATVTYHMNRLQSLTTREAFCVTLNGGDAIDPSKVLRRMEVRHPLYTADAVRAQRRWGEVSGANRTHFCGAYWFYGFHEDGLNSALRVARALGVEC